MIKLIEGVVDIYLADMRYSSDTIAKKYSLAEDYPQNNRKAIKQMHAQVGILQMDKKGIATQGLIIRHLVLPNDLSGTENTMRFISEEVSPETYISLMSQYSPYYKADRLPGICRRIRKEEYTLAQEIMEKYGLHNGWMQEDGGISELAGVHITPSISHAHERR